MKTAIIVPTYRAEATLPLLLDSLQQQTHQPDSVLVIDSSSTDQTTAIVRQYPNIQLKIIPQKTFNHGGTRQQALAWVEADLYCYMTQDAILASPETLYHLFCCFENSAVGCAYGRQLPHKNANLLGAHLRHFNYPTQTEYRTLADVPRLGIKTCANSNSFSAYRKTALVAVGGFPKHVILGEDVWVAARLLMADWQVAYCAEACVYHSHNYSAFQDFRRYFDIGAFHAMNTWLLGTFKTPDRLGNQYVRSELRWCWQHHAYLTTLCALWHSALKWLGYRLGRQYNALPKKLRKCCSMHAFFWK